MEPMPCPFCGGNELAIHEIEECISCYECGARGPTFSPIIRGRRSTWQTRRAPDPLREALLWKFAAMSLACCTTNDETMAMMMNRAAHAEIERLLREAFP